jgi:hypothetical protein
MKRYRKGKLKTINQQGVMHGNLGGLESTKIRGGGENGLKK